MRLKEVMQQDIESTFFSKDEFSEDFKWDNQIIQCVLDDEDLIRKYSSEFETLPQGSHLIYAAEKQFIKTPHVDDVVRLNGILYIINEIKKDYGVLAIFLSNGRG